MRVSFVLLLVIFGWIILNTPNDSLWYDETVNAYLADSSWSTIWEWSTEVDNQLPLHFMALKIWQGLVGDSAFALRLFSQFSVWLAAAGLISLGRHLGGHYRAGWLAAIFFALSGAFLYAAAEVRTYALALALLMWSSVILWHLLRKQSQWLPLYWLLAIALAYTHYTAWFALAAHCLWCLLHRRVRLLLAIASGLTIGILPWLVALGGRDFNAGTAFEGQVAVGRALKTYISFYSFGQKVFTEHAHQLGLMMGGLVIFAALVWLWNRPHVADAVFLLTLMALPVVVLVYAANQIEAKLAGRHAWVMWPVAALLLGLGINKLYQRLPRHLARWTVIATAMILPVRIQFLLLEEQYVGDFRRAFSIINRHAHPDDLLILRDGTLFTTAEYYDSDIAYIGIPNDKLTDVDHQVRFHEAVNLLQSALTPDTQHIWVLSWQGDTMDPMGLAFALPEYYSDGERTVWLRGDNNEVTLISYDLNKPLPQPLFDHIVDYPGVLQVPPDGARLLGYEVYHTDDCAILLHTWWWRGDTDYPSTMISLRLINTTTDTRVAQQDQPPAGFHYPQERWTPYEPILGRIELKYPCDAPIADYQLQMVVYDSNGEKPEQPVSLSVEE